MNRSSVNCKYHRFLTFFSVMGLCVSISIQANTAIASTQPPEEKLTVMRICYEDENNFPFITESNADNNQDNALGQRGTLADLIIIAADQLNLPVNMIRKPWKRCLKNLELGRVDAIFAAIWTSKRDDLGVFPKTEGSIDPKQRLWRAEYPIFTAKQTNLQWRDGQLSGLQFGISAPLGYIAHEKLNQLSVLPKNNLTPKEGLTLVAKGRLDGYVVEKHIGMYLINQLGLAHKISRLPEDFMQMDWFMPVSHQWYQQHPELTLQLWKAISDVREHQGDAIFNRYLAQ